MCMGLLEMAAYYVCFHIGKHEDKIVEYKEWLSTFYKIMTKEQ